MEPEVLVDRAMEIAATIASNAPLGIQVTKKAGRAYIEQGEKAAVDILPEVRETVFGTEDQLEGIQSFMERREAVFKGR